ncbi:50S ribosomal protein L13 [Candidatus Gracilibacteria bacterium]|nr:MAG: 50S ribosomal protein L13 [Candidatus Gracilibacteria bacterium]
MKTISPKQVKGNERKWYVIDAKGETLGRLATKIAVILMGKNKASYAPFLDNGDYIIVLNCDKFSVTGKKLSDKTYYTHSGYLGGLKEANLETLLEKKPTRVLELAVSGMLPKNKLRAGMLARLKLFTGDEHTFVAQNPELIK